MIFLRAVLGDYLGVIRPMNWAFSKSSIEKFETARWVACWALEKG